MYIVTTALHDSQDNVALVNEIVLVLQGCAAHAGEASDNVKITSQLLVAQRALRLSKYRDEVDQESKAKKRKCCDTADLP